MSTEPTPQQAATLTPSPASPAITPYPMQGVVNPNTSTPASVPSSTTDPVSQPNAQNTPPQLQAAQLSHKVETNGLLAGGAKPPSPPSKPQKKRTKKSNKLDFRADDELLNLVLERMALTGMSESETMRQLVEAGLGAPVIILTPKAPPEQLEVFLGAMQSWRRDFQAVKSRLNAPMPRNLDDEELVSLVKQWRTQSQLLLDRIPKEFDFAKGVLKIMTSLIPEKIKWLRDEHKTLRRWKKDREEKAAKETNIITKGNHELHARNYQTLIELIEDLGIKPNQ